METLLKYIFDLITEDFDSADKVASVEGVLDDADYASKEKIDSIDLLLTGRVLSKIGAVLEEKAYDRALERIKNTDEKSVEYFGSKVSLVTTEQWDFLEDEVYFKYSDLIEKKSKELKELRNSLKIRGENLIESNRALKLKSKETLRIKL